MAHRKMSEVVSISEGVAAIGLPRDGSVNASRFLVCRLFTDAVFNQDIRAIQLIINRIDGGVPRDDQMDLYQTEFSDCLNEIMAMQDGTQLKVMPDDTVMMALCKSLYDLSVQDIYSKEVFDKEGKVIGRRKCKPSTDKKKERDSALRMVLERTGGRKTIPEVKTEQESLETAHWISELPEYTC